MKLKDVIEFAKQEAQRYQAEITIVESEVFNEPDAPINFCATQMLDILYPENHSDYFTILGTVSPTGRFTAAKKVCVQ